MVGIAIMPQAYVIYTSFKNTQGKIFVDGYSLQSYQTAIGKLGRSIQNTIIIPLLALVVIVLLAVLIAYLVVRRRNALTNVVDILSMIPYIVPGTVLGIALLIGFNKPPLLISGTMLIMVVALIIRRLPYTIRSSVAILQQIPMSIEEAAISLGASKMKAFFRITVPMMASGIISGAILSWVTMISELSTAIILYTGKTKTLISLVSEAIEKEQGNVVCIEKSRHLTYDIPYQARLIRTDDYGVRGNTMLLGFLCGLHAGNYDITHFFIDDLNKILDDLSLIHI